MTPAVNRHQRLKIFAWVVIGCVTLAVGYTYWVVQRGYASAALNQADSPGTLLPIADPDELIAIQNQPHLIFINEEEPYFGQVKFAGLDLQSPVSLQTALSCGRVYFAAGSGICLSLEDSAMDSFVRVTIFGSDFKPRHQLRVEGIPTRARISPDGKYAAFTVFVSGHSYDDINMSTFTALLDTSTGISYGNLEEFEVWNDGRLYEAPDFNFWGVTFAQDSNRFYATVKFSGKTYLVQGDIAAHRVTVFRENVECPSLSPDGTRIAFKKLTSTGRWQLTVLDLATMNETTLAENGNIDDQAEWLDDQRILYQKVDYDAPRFYSIFVLPADGSGEPQIFIPNATSPVVVR